MGVSHHKNRNQPATVISCVCVILVASFSRPVNDKKMMIYAQLKTKN